jgi:septal ring factor EnvC (AmiA/AmiB activator)
MVIAYGAELADYARTVKRLNAENAELKTALADEKAYSARLRKTIKKKWEALTKLEDKRLALEKRIDQRREPGE